MVSGWPVELPKVEVVSGWPVVSLEVEVVSIWSVVLPDVAGLSVVLGSAVFTVLLLLLAPLDSVVFVSVRFGFGGQPAATRTTSSGRWGLK